MKNLSIAIALTIYTPIALSDCIEFKGKSYCDEGQCVKTNASRSMAMLNAQVGGCEYERTKRCVVKKRRV